ncbi:MAG: class I SAM-dependent methyltransferase [Pseudomonadota bacterium]|nr:class I SAM-dependent methyltransferase [Pseudomonadota bacterium]
MITAMSEGGILQDQIDYYRARAGEYDEWWFRTGRYDRGPEFNARWRAEIGTLETALDTWLTARRPQTLLELACGTGLFTRRIAPRVPHITAVDASPEVLAINRSRVAAANVDYIQADLFSWRPAARYDAVFFSFWLSHVPEDRFAAFWDTVAAALAPGGAAYLIDSAFDPTSTAKDHVLPARDAGIVTRKLNDGREFRIVKLFWEPQALAAQLAALGWSATVAKTPSYFIHGSAQPASQGKL